MFTKCSKEAKTSSWNRSQTQCKPVRDQARNVQSMSEGGNSRLEVIGMPVIACFCLKWCLNCVHILSENFTVGLLMEYFLLKGRGVHTKAIGATGWHECSSIRDHTGPSPILNVDAQ